MWLVQYNDYVCTAIARIVQYFGETVGSIALLRMQHARFSRYGPILPHQINRPRSQARIDLIPFSDTPHHVFHPHAEGNTPTPSSIRLRRLAHLPSIACNR